MSDLRKTCKCKIKKELRDQFLTEYCVDCGRIWYNDLCGGSRSTEMFEPIPLLMEGIWVGDMLIKGPKQLVSQLKKILT